jgi:hypothetical protein
MFDEVVATIRKDPENEKMLAMLDAAAARFDAYAKSGKLDDDVMRTVDGLLGRAIGLVKDHEAHEHHHGTATGWDIHSRAQTDRLDKSRGTAGIGTAAKEGRLVDGLKTAVDPRQAKSAADLTTEAITVPKERFRAEVDRIFGHPYDSNWWVPIVVGWAKKNPHVLGQYIRDRNEGKAEVH